MKEIEAYLYGHKIGTLINYKGVVYFEYEKDFKKLDLEISPLKLDTKKINSAYSNEDLKYMYFGLAGVFHDSLPDKHGMAFINRYFERQGLNINEVTNLHKLAFIGNRGMGAIEYRPSEHEESNDLDIVIEAKEAFEEMKKYIENKDTSISDLMNILDSVSPVGGGRPKMLIQYNYENNTMKLNKEKLEKGFKRVILKFDEAYYENESIGLTKLEYVFMSMAKDAGIRTANFQLIKEKGLQHLILERFDRDESDNKIHMSTASALSHVDFSIAQGSTYEMLFRLTRKLSNSHADIEELFRRMVFNILAFNFDDHLKNFSYLMDKEGKWSLSPAYDITYSKGEAKEHITTISGKSIDFTLIDILKVSNSFLIKENKAMNIIEESIAVLKTFEQRAIAIEMDENEMQSCLLDINSQIELLQS